MKNKKLSICSATVHPGEEANLALPLPEEFSCSSLYMPIKVIHGKKSGPCLLIFSVLRGTELNGLEIANRIGKEFSSSQISGTLIIVPAVNVYSLTRYPAMMPSGSNLSQCFPGDQNGTFGERIAHIFTEEILNKADYCIELQTGGINHNILPQVYCNFTDKKSKQLATVFEAPVVTDVSLKSNELRKTTEMLGIPLLVYQGGEALRFDENAISLGYNGIKNVMREIDILEKEPQTEIQPIFSSDEDWIYSNSGGILHPMVSLGQTISVKEIIGTITDPFMSEVVESIKSPREGIVVGVNMSPFIHEGSQIFNIASFKDYDKAETAIEEWEQLQKENSED